MSPHQCVGGRVKFVNRSETRGKCPTCYRTVEFFPRSGWTRPHGPQKRRDDLKPVSVVLAARKRVLKLVEGYLAKLPQGTLMSDEHGGLMTWGEIRRHVKAAIDLKAAKEIANG